MARVDPLTYAPIEDAIVQALRGSSQLRSLAKTILPYHQARLDEEITTSTDPLPAIYVFFERSDVFGETAYEELETFYFTVLVVDASLADRNTTARLGGQYNVGSYALLEAVRKTLVLNNCGIDNLTPLWRREVTAVPGSQTLSVYAATYVSENNLVPAVNRAN